MVVIYFFIIFFIIYNVSIKNSKNTKFLSEEKLKTYFSNVQKIYSTSNMSLYKGDKSGENFLLAIKFSSNPTSKLDLSTIYDIAEKNHIHNKILFSDEYINPNSLLYKTLESYEIQILSNYDFQKLTCNSDFLSVLRTSNTSDDNCNIDESTNPIQYEKNTSYGILSFFKSKPDRL